MLEIVGIIMFCKHLAGLAEGKGRPKSWAALGALFWILGEFLGAMIGVAVVGDGIMMYVAALAGAAVGAVVAWMIVSGLSPIQGIGDAYGQAGAGAGMGDEHAYKHADADNPYSPPGFGRRD